MPTPLISYDLLVLGGPVWGTGTVPHCAVLSSFVATMGKVSRTAAGGPSYNSLNKKSKTFNYCIINFENKVFS